MIPTRKLAELLAREFLPLRGKLLEVAAALDRIDRAADAQPDERLIQLHQALQALAAGPDGRAEAIQRIFSLPYDPDWRDEFGLTRQTS